MIARPHVCMTCQLRLLKRSTASKYNFASLSTRAIPHPVSEESIGESCDEPKKRTEGTSGLDDAISPLTAVTIEDGNTITFPLAGRSQFVAEKRLSQTQRNGLSEHPLGKLFGYTGSMQREGRETLEIESLGKAAEVIVLRDSGLKFTRRTTVIPEAEKAEAVDILATLNRERGMVAHTQVDENISTFRPEAGEEPQDRQQFNELVQQIQSSFTISQLAKYIQTFSSGKDSAAPSLRNAIKAKLIRRITPFLPQAAIDGDPTDPASVRGYSYPSYTPKQRLALRVMRECWKLRLPELEDGIGEIEVELNSPDFQLLMNKEFGSQVLPSTMEDISARHIVRHGERIETFMDNNTFRIVATRAKCEAVVEDIEQALGSIQRREVNLRNLRSDCKYPEFNSWVEKNFDDSTINQLGGLTRTDIKVSHKKRVFIAGVEENSKNSNLRTDAAVRLLLTSGDFSGRAKNWLGCKGPSDGALHQYPVSDNFSWRDRLRPWARWTSPVAKETDEGKLSNQVSPTWPDKVKPIAAGTQTEQTASLVDVKPADSVPNTLHWSKTPNTVSSTIFGNLLFSCASPQNIKNITALERLAPNFPKLFTTNIPNISRILAARTAHLTLSRPIQTVRMRFLPNPFANVPKSNPAVQLGHKALAAYPLIEMQFAVRKRDGVLDLKTIKAILSTENSDLLLPESSVDLRFQQKVTSELHIPKCSNGLRHVPQGISSFLSSSNLSMKDGKGRLATPARLKIPLQAHLCLNPDFKALGIENPEQDIFEVPYVFAGLEILNTMVMETDSGWKLRYKSIEAGRAGGRRAELELLPIRRTAEESNSEKAFIKEAFRIAAALDRGPVGVRATADSSEHKIKWWKVKGAKREFYSKKVTVGENTDAMDDRLKDNTTQEALSNWEAVEELKSHEVELLRAQIEAKQLIDALEEEGEESHQDKDET